jgi:hypothetical protein
VTFACGLLVSVLSLIGNPRILSLGETDTLLDCVTHTWDIKMVVDFVGSFGGPRFARLFLESLLLTGGSGTFVICCLIWAGGGVLSMAFTLTSSP